MFSDLKIVTGSSNPELAKAICDHLGCQLTPTLATTFSDGELRIEIGDNVRGDDVFVVQPTCPPLVNLSGWRVKVSAQTSSPMTSSGVSPM